MNGLLRRNRIGILLTLLILICVAMALRHQLGGMNLGQVLSMTDGNWIFGAFLCAVSFFICEAVNIGRGLEMAGEDTSFLQNLKYAMAGFFFSSITPGASGGQPAQLYLMSQDKIRISKGIFALLLELLSFQSAVVMLGAAGYLYVKVTGAALYVSTQMRVLLETGYLLNLLALAALVAVMFSGRFFRLAAGAVKWIIPGRKYAAYREMLRYRRAASMVGRHRETMVMMVGTSLLQLLVFHFTVLFVYRSLGLWVCHGTKIIAFQSLIYSSVSIIPLPGGEGITEAAFSGVFSHIFTGINMGAGITLVRMSQYLIPLLLSGLGLLFPGQKTEEGKDGNRFMHRQEKGRNNICFEEE